MAAKTHFDTNFGVSPVLGTYGSNAVSLGQQQQYSQQQQQQQHEEEEEQVQGRQQEQEQEQEQDKQEQELELGLGQEQRPEEGQQQKELEQKKQQQQQQEQEQEQGLQRVQRPGDKSIPCDFCAKRKRRCDGLLPRYSTFIDKNKPHCHYHQRHPAKADSKAVAAYRPRASIDLNRPVRPGQAPIDVGMVATSRGLIASDLLGTTSLKRCKLSPSPATGLVGMQENAFLSDYFGCMGFLPLASASTARQAMVNIMLGGANAQQRYERGGLGAGNFAGQGHRGAPQRGQAGGWGQGLAYHDRAGNASKCIFWSAIALGALLRGRSLKFVTGYVKLARDSLAECFDGTCVDTARAYLVMAFLCRFLGDQTKNEEYIAFASSIVETLPSELVPSDLENLFLVLRQEFEVMNYGRRSLDSPVKPKAKSKDTDKPLAVHRVVHDRDLCNIIFAADRRMHQDIVEGMGSDGYLANIEREGEVTPDGAMDGELERFQEQVEWATTGGVDAWADGRVEAGLRPSFGASDWVRSGDGGMTPPLRAETMTFVGDVLPELERVSSVVERSGMCSGIGGVFYHGAKAYVHIIKGERKCAFQSIRVFTGVMAEFPGICRFRPHLMHGALLAAASSMCPVLYEPIREVYNSVLPANFPPAPPLEEWSGAACICNHVLCRSFEVSTNYVGFGPRTQSVPSERATGVPTPPDSSFGLRSFPVKEGTHGSSYCLGCGARAALSSASTMVTEAGPPLAADEMRRSSHTQAGASLQHTANLATGVIEPTEVMSAVIPLVSLEAHRFGDDGNPRDIREEAGDDCGLRVQELEQISIDFLSGLDSEDQSESGTCITDEPAVARTDPAVVPVGDSIWCDGRMENVDAPAVVDDVAVVNDPTSCGDLLLFDGEPEGAGLCWTEDGSMDAAAGLGLTDDYLMDAAEALMSSSPLDG